MFKAPEAKGAPTTISRRVQAAAARALDGVSRPAAIVAVRGHTGEVLAVADRLGGGNDGQNAFRGYYPPGSAFAVLVLRGGSGASAAVPVAARFLRAL